MSKRKKAAVTATDESDRPNPLGDSLADLKFQPKGKARKRTGKTLDMSKAREARKQILAEAAATAKDVTEAMNEMARCVAYQVEKVKEYKQTFLADLDWLPQILFNTEIDIAVVYAAWAAMAKAAFAVDFEDHDEFARVLDWMVKQGWMTSVASKPTGEGMYHRRKLYSFPDGAFPDGNDQEAVLDFRDALNKIWKKERIRWTELDKEMANEGSHSWKDLIDGKPGDYYLRVKDRPVMYRGKFVYHGGKKVEVEGGSILVNSDGRRLRISKVANEVKRTNGKPAWDNFGLAMRHAMAIRTTISLRDIFCERFVLPRGTPRERAGKMALYHDAIRKGIYNERVISGDVKPRSKPAKPKPIEKAKKTVKKVVKKTAKKATKAKKVIRA